MRRILPCRFPLLALWIGLLLPAAHVEALDDLARAIQAVRPKLELPGHSGGGETWKPDWPEWKASGSCGRAATGGIYAKAFVEALPSCGYDVSGEEYGKLEGTWEKEPLFLPIRLLNVLGGASLGALQCAAEKAIDQAPTSAHDKEIAKSRVRALKSAKEIFDFLTGDPSALGGGIDDAAHSDGSRVRELGRGLRSLPGVGELVKWLERDETVELLARCEVDSVEATVRDMRKATGRYVAGMIENHVRMEQHLWCYLKKLPDPLANFRLAESTFERSKNPMVALRAVADANPQQTGGVSTVAWFYRDRTNLETAVEEYLDLEAFLERHDFTAANFKKRRKLLADRVIELNEWATSAKDSLTGCRTSDFAGVKSRLDALRSKECYETATSQVSSRDAWLGRHPLGSPDGILNAIRRAEAVVETLENHVVRPLEEAKRNLECDLGEARRLQEEAFRNLTGKLSSGEQDYAKVCLNPWPFDAYRDARRARFEELNRRKDEAETAVREARSALAPCEWDEVEAKLGETRAALGAVGCTLDPARYCERQPGRWINPKLCELTRVRESADDLELALARKRNDVGARIDSARGRIQGLLDYAGQQAALAEPASAERCEAISEVHATATQLREIEVPTECPDPSLPDPKQESSRLRALAGKLGRRYGGPFEEHAKAGAAALEECRLEEAETALADMTALAPALCDDSYVAQRTEPLRGKIEAKRDASAAEHERLARMLDTAQESAKRLLASAAAEDPGRCRALEGLEEMAASFEGERPDAKLAACRDDWPDLASFAAEIRGKAEASSTMLAARASAAEDAARTAAERCDASEVRDALAEIEALEPLLCDAVPGFENRLAALRTRATELAESADGARDAVAKREADAEAALAVCDTKRLAEAGRALDACLLALLDDDSRARFEKVRERTSAAQHIDTAIADARRALEEGERELGDCRLSPAAAAFRRAQAAAERLGSQWGAECSEANASREAAAAGLQQIAALERSIGPVRRKVAARLELAQGYLREVRRPHTANLDPARFAAQARIRLRSARQALVEARESILATGAPRACFDVERGKIAAVAVEIDGIVVADAPSVPAPDFDRDSDFDRAPGLDDGEVDDDLDDFFADAIDGAAEGLGRAGSGRDRSRGRNTTRLAGATDRIGGAVDGYDPDVPDIDDFIDAVERNRPRPPRGGGRGDGRGGLQDVYCNDGSVTLKVWDHSSQDGDVVSLWLGGQRVLGGFDLDRCGGSEPAGGPCVAQRRISAARGVDVRILAHNEGSSPPNTAALLVLGGCTPERQQYRLKEGQSAQITIYRAR